MKWRKLGKIFDPLEHTLPNNCRAFAQSPQALVLPDRVRIYFSTREQDAPGKYLSHIAFADFDLGLKEFLGVSTSPVIDLGNRGCFDEHGIFPFNVLRENTRILAYSSGWSRRVSVPIDGAIGLAVSCDDGLTFEKFGQGPVMAPTFNEPFLIGDPFVAKYADCYHMWYIFGVSWIKRQPQDAPDRIYKIAHAVSQDGINWTRDGKQIVPDRLNDLECQALPTVICIDGTYHMYFCYRQAYGFREQSKHAYRIGYAHSTDLENWVRDDSLAGIDVSNEGWDSQMQCYPHVFACNGDVFMLYNGNEFGRFGFGIAILERT